MKNRLLVMVAAAAALSAPAIAQGRGEIGYPAGSLGYDALVAGDYATAEKQLRALKGVAKNDPARLINLGQVLARTGRTAEAERLFERARRMEETEIILADGRLMSSQRAAQLALQSLRRTDPGSR